MPRVWIHRILLTAGDLFVPFASEADAIVFAKKFLIAQPGMYFSPPQDNNPYDTSVFHEENQLFVGGCSYTQVILITDDYTPESGWKFWANTFTNVTQEQALALGGTGSLNVDDVSLEPWEK